MLKTCWILVILDCSSYCIAHDRRALVWVWAGWFCSAHDLMAHGSWQMYIESE